jgi:sulfite oxidase
LSGDTRAAFDHEFLITNDPSDIQLPFFIFIMSTAMTPRSALRVGLRCLRPSCPPACHQKPLPICRCFNTASKRTLDSQRSRFFSSRSRTTTQSSQTSSSKSTGVFAAAAVAAGLLSFSLAAAFSKPALLDAVQETIAPSLQSGVDTGAETTEADDPAVKDLPRYRLSEIRKHNGTSPNPWVIHGDKVYDITEWVSAHPGGDVILRAAGGSIDRYWDIFSIHKNPYVYEILSQYHIGYVDGADLSPEGGVADVVEDPFSQDPTRHAALITRTEKPRNAETPGFALEESFLTPNDLFYIRNHMWVPTADDIDAHVLTIELPDGSTKKYTVDELKTRFPHRSVTAVLQCSGNRRANMSDGSKRKANGLPWETGAISNATWEGCSLADVLSDAGFKSDYSKLAAKGVEAPSQRQDEEEEEEDQVNHVHFSGMEAYAASIPIHKAIDPRGDVLLAWGMNGKPLPRDHGFPLRSVVPGHVAARSVKWLNKITLSDEESTSQWQRRDYKCFGPNETKVDWDAAPAIQEMPVQSAITKVKIGSSQTGSDRTVSMGGYAYSGGGRAIIRVDVSLDDGKTWTQAHLLPDCSGNPSQCSGHANWAWKRWRYDGVIPALQPSPSSSSSTTTTSTKDTAAEGRRCTQLVVKATDEAYNTQPESHAATWNIRGNLATAWHRVQVCSDCKDGMQKTIPPSS